MTKYSKLADLESLVQTIDDPNVRAYAQESVNSYFAEAYRAAIVSIWIAVVYDLYQKTRYLAELYKDNAAKISIDEINKIRNSSDKKQIASWEREILRYAHDDIHMITDTEYEHLERIQKDRHRCAHPVLDSEGLLFQPSPELTRTHIRTAIEVVLSQPPIMGKASGDALTRDVEGNYFPSDIEGVKKILEERHLFNSDKYVNNLLLLSLKNILYIDHEFTNYIDRYILVAVCIFQKYPNILEKIELTKLTNLTNLLNSTKEDRYEFLYRILSKYNIGQLWPFCSSSLKEKFKSFLEQDHSSSALVIALLVFLREKSFEEAVENYKKMMPEDKKKFIEKVKEYGNLKELILELIPINLDIFTDSGSFAGGRNNALNLIEPIKNYLEEDHVIKLLEDSIHNQKGRYTNQLIDCESTFIEIFDLTINSNPVMLEKWQLFLDEFGHSWEDLESKIQNRLEKI